MTVELAKTYDPQQVQTDVWQQWKSADAFHAEPDEPGDPYVIVIPPPNVTAALHLGHALNNTLQDVLIRWRRMCGDNAVWLPGTDHAGIATQTVVDKRLQAEGQPALKDYKKLEAAGEDGREQFIEKVQAWKDEYEARITEQLMAMGCSCDWARQAFTMDQVRAKAVRQAFFQLYKDGLIYRGKRLVNWDPATQTALADDEVEMHEIDGHFWYMKYPLVDEAGRGASAPPEEYVTVATTRPETMLGDTAVAVNPNDPRRAPLIGRQVRLPIVNRVIPIVGDDYVVIPDPDSDDAKAKYTSGFLKVTPAHDPNDWEIGQRHHLSVVNVMAPDGTISKEHGWPSEEWDQGKHDDILENLLGMDRYEAREAIVEWFRENNLLQEVKPYRHTVGHSYRSHVAIEPYLSDQWYVKVTDERLAGAALRAMDESQRSEGECVWTEEHPFRTSRAHDQGLEDAEARRPLPDGRGSSEASLRFTPDRYAKTFQLWHENIRDWCISRQLWWGHRIPVWRRPHALTQPPANVDDVVETLQQWYFEGRVVTQYRGEFVDLAEVEKQDLDLTTFFYCVRDPDGEDRHIVEFLESIGLEQDPDVLDTWFSSALWPLSTLGWPEHTAELERWNPTSVLSTAREIITLWVSRMVMFNMYFRGCVPFTDVFIHAMIQDGEGRKMSKSLGNGVDPLDIIHTHGADAMRFTLVQMTTQTQDVRMPVERCEETGRNTSPKFDIGRNFCNKLWNAARFALGNFDNAPAPSASEGTNEVRSLADRWILSRLARTVRQTDESLGGFQFNGYAQGLYDFFWRDLCDWYLEAIKPVVRQDTPQGAAARATLAACLDASIRLLHPIAPFITERLFAELNRLVPQRSTGGIALPPADLCIKAAWPTVEDALVDQAVEQRFDLLQQVITAVRDMRSTYKIPPRDTPALRIKASGEEQAALQTGRDLIQTLASVEIEEIGDTAEKPDDAAATVLGPIELYLCGVVDSDAEQQRLTKRLAELEKSRGALAGRLNNPGYVDKAPAHLVEQTRRQLADVDAELDSIRNALSALK